MPKVILNVRENILLAAKELLLRGEAGAFTVRAVASQSHVAVGTVYNYFPSKDLLAAGVMLEDWMALLGRLKAECEGAKSLRAALEAVFRGVRDFSDRYRSAWENYSAQSGAAVEFVRRHRLLADQLSECLRASVEAHRPGAPEELPLFLAENLLLCAGKSDLSLEALLRILESANLVEREE